jgi:hypothetical protein
LSIDGEHRFALISAAGNVDIHNSGGDLWRYYIYDAGTPTPFEPKLWTTEITFAFIDFSNQDAVLSDDLAGFEFDLSKFDRGMSNELYLRGILDPELDPHTLDDEGNPTTLGFDIQGVVTSARIVPEPAALWTAACGAALALAVARARRASARRIRRPAT